MHPHPPTAPSLQLRLQARPESAGLLRQRLCLWLDELGANAEEIFDLSLASTEAFANAVEHPYQPTTDLIHIDGSINDGVIAISVRDSGSWREHRHREHGGYGFPLMRQHMDTVEVRTEPGGTTIAMQRQIAKPLRFH